jgi:serine/threonine protein kinase
MDHIIKLYGISQDPNTKNYIMVLEYAEDGNLNDYLNKNYESFDWFKGLKILTEIINGLSKIHQKKMIHHNFHTGNILFTKGIFYVTFGDSISDIGISDIGLYRKIDDVNETSIYGVMPYVAPEVLKGKLYT